ncbi:MAG: hypothetical protein ACF8QF_01345 [Phycisphaerales bacterium]
MVIRRTRGVGVALALGVVTLLGGCAGYSTYPKVEGMALADVNSLGAQEAMVTALRYVAARRPLGEPYAVNLPVGTLKERMEVIINRTEDPSARLLTKENADLPRVHITRVWLRATKAEVDVLRPVAGVAGPEGEPTYESYTLRLDGGFRPWKVTDARRWMVGVVPAPAPNWYEDAPAGGGRVPEGG